MDIADLMTKTFIGWGPSISRRGGNVVSMENGVSNHHGLTGN